MNENEKKLFIRVSADNLDRAAKNLRTQKDFSWHGLKKLHDDTFTASPLLPKKVQQEMQSYIK